MNPPNQKKGVKDYLISKTEGYSNLYVIDSYLINNRVIDFMRLRLKWTGFYDTCLYRLVKRIARQQLIQFYQVWSFDPNLHGYLYKYPAAKKIFFIADQIQNSSQSRAAKNTDLVVSVAEELLSQFRPLNKNCLLINHGLNNSYRAYALKNAAALLQQDEIVVQNKSSRIQVGYIGNLLIPALYEEGLLEIVTKHPDIDFHFWGAHEAAGNNLLASYDNKIFETIQFIKQNCTNTFFYGIKQADEIIAGLHKVDLFIYVNSSVKDVNGGANSHKILEYLSTGKTIASTYLSFYNDTGLLKMTAKGDEGKFADLFSDAVINITENNAPENCLQRINYALANTYQDNILKIKNHI